MESTFSCCTHDPAQPWTRPKAATAPITIPFLLTELAKNLVSKIDRKVDHVHRASQHARVPSRVFADSMVCAFDDHGAYATQFINTIIVYFCRR